MGVTRNIDGAAGTVMLTPLWVTQRAFVLAWFEVSLEQQGSPDETATAVFPVDLTVQLWSRRKPGDTFSYVAETVLPAGQKRKIAAQLNSGFGFDLPVVLAAGAENVVVYNAEGVYVTAPPNITVTPHGTWA